MKTKKEIYEELRFKHLQNIRSISDKEKLLELEKMLTGDEIESIVSFSLCKCIEAFYEQYDENKDAAFKALFATIYSAFKDIKKVEELYNKQFIQS